jgi:hypothetical protein
MGCYRHSPFDFLLCADVTRINAVSGLFAYAVRPQRLFDLSQLD